MLQLLQNGLISIASVIVVLGIMVLIHEWGHYIVAKSLGVTVEIFSIGFGSRLFGWRKNGTDYRVSALPFGGYVKMKGDNPLEATTDDPGEFLNHSRWHRFLIALAGPTVNILFAILLLTCLYKFHYERPLGEGEPPTIGTVDDDSAAQKAGLLPGDKIIAIGDKRNPDWSGVLDTIALSPNQPVTITVQRGSELKTLSLTPRLETRDGVGTLDFEPARQLIITTLRPGFPAEAAGLQIGDTIQTVNGRHVYSTLGLWKQLQQTDGAPVRVEAIHQGKPETLTIKPAKINESGKDQYVLGIVSNPHEVVKLPWGESLAKSLQQNGQNAAVIVELAKKMLQRKISVKAVSGPVGIAQVSGQVARTPGWTPKLEFMSLISINLGVMNLFPIPILDGGVILLLFIEGLMRRDISLPVKERIYQASFVFLVLFAAIVVFNDFAKMR